MKNQNLTLAAKESDLLAQQLRDLEIRRDEWAIQSEQAEAILSEVRSKALAGEASAAEITTAQSEHSALVGLLSQADAQLIERRTLLNSAIEQERQQRVNAEIEASKARREQARLDYLAARERASAILQEPLKAMFNARRTFGQEGRELKRLYSSVGSEVEFSDRFATPQVEPFGYEVDLAYAHFVNNVARQEERQRMQERRARDRAAPTAA